VSFVQHAGLQQYCLYTSITTETVFLCIMLKVKNVLLKIWPRTVVLTRSPFHVTAFYFRNFQWVCRAILTELCVCVFLYLCVCEHAHEHTCAHTFMWTTDTNMGSMPYVPNPQFKMIYCHTKIAIYFVFINETLCLKIT